MERNFDGLGGGGELVLRESLYVHTMSFDSPFLIYFSSKDQKITHTSHRKYVYFEQRSKLITYINCQKKQ